MKRTTLLLSLIIVSFANFSQNLTISTSSLSDFSQIIETPSTPQSFTVSGTGLVSDITLTTSFEYEISLTNGSGFTTSSLILSPDTNGEVDMVIYVCLNASYVGYHFGYISIDSPDAGSFSVWLEGQTTGPVISTSASSLIGFQSGIGMPSTQQPFTILGTNLMDSVTVTAPSEYEISLTNGSGFTDTLILSPDISGAVDTIIYVRLNASSVGAHSGYIVLSSIYASADIFVSGQTDGPMISTSASSLSGFQSGIGMPSTQQSFTVSGIELMGDITLTAPLGYEISLTNGSGFTDTLILPPDINGAVDTVIYVRLNAGSVGIHSGNISLTSMYASANVSVSGQTLGPTINPSVTSLNSLFNQMIGTPSDSKVFVMSGLYLDSVVTVTAPAGYEISYTHNSGFTDTLILSPDINGGIPNTAVFVRLNADSPGIYSGYIFLKSINATSKNVYVTGIANTIETSVSNLHGFEQTLGSPSVEKTFNITGENLTDDVVLTASDGYEISLSSNAGFTTLISIPYTDGSLSETVYVRLNAATIGSHTGNVTTASLNALDVVVNLNGVTLGGLGISNVNISDLKLYPIPFEETVNISAPSNIKEIQVVDLSGKIVKQVLGNNTTVQQISATELNSGVYVFIILTIEDNFRVQAVKK